ncbi:NAD(P)-dependent oxidoreductase, partial [Nonomuraea dietziae]|uniref:NAD(P)-dependent oxidoreductase n=1 Tax=Nonomuraea dietziae TaxID=65515 RepID=UPI0034373017
MRITVFGAAGAVGSRVVTEALSRGHHVTAVVRDPSRHQQAPTPASLGVGDATVPADAARLIAGHDLVITAVRPAPGHEADLVTATQTLLSAAHHAATRILLVGGAATLTVPGSGATMVLDVAGPPAPPPPPPPGRRGRPHAGRGPPPAPGGHQTPPPPHP